MVLLAHLPGIEPLSDLVPLAIALDQHNARQPNPICWRGAGAPRVELRQGAARDAIAGANTSRSS